MRNLLGCIAASSVLSLVVSAAPTTIRLLANAPSPQKIGTRISLTAQLENMAKGMHVFRYTVSVDGGPFHVIRDFSQQKQFIWSPALQEQSALVRVTARNNETKDSVEAELPFKIISRVNGSSPVVTPTSHPLVALFSGPPCPAGAQFRVAFRREGEEVSSYTPLQPCRASFSNNVYVAGMRSDQEYRLRQEWVSGTRVTPGTWLPFHTGIGEGDFPPISIAVRRTGTAPIPEPVLIHSVNPAFAADLDGNVIWYLPYRGSLTRVLPGGRFLVIAEGQNSVNDMRRGQVLREHDLAGNVIHETNVSRVAEQLDRFGIHSDCRKGGKECVSGFHHDAIRLPNGHTLVIAGLERILPEGTQGAKEAVDILGDIVVDLDEDFQAAAVWNCFDHFDLKRASLENAKCKLGAGGGGCPPIFLAPEANGWTHSNSLNYIPSTGDFLVSMPEQDWVIKVDWKNGKGSGKVLWRLGEGGDFTAQSTDPHPWFSYQHDAGFEPTGSNLLSILDDGNARFKNDPKSHTRGQVWKLDEEKRIATLVQNADLGTYSFAVGSAQTLKNGGYSFNAGFINEPSPYSRSVETDAHGKIVYAQQIESTDYRSFRVPNLYTAPPK